LGAVQTTVDENGGFSAELVLPESVGTGTYNIFLVPEYGDKYSGTFEHQSRGIINNALRAINVQSGTATVDKIAEVTDTLQIDTAYLTAEGFDKENYAVLLASEKPTDGWSTISKLEKSMDIAKAVYDINKAESESKLDEAIKAYGEASDFNSEEYSSLYSTIKSAVAKKVINEEDFISAEAFENFFRAEKIICSITDAPNWSYSKSVLESDYINSLVSSSAKNKLEELKYPEEVYKNVYKSRSGITDIESVVKAYEKAIEEVYDDEQKNKKPTGGNVGGGGGSYGGGGIVAPAPTVTVDLQETESFSDLDSVEWAREAIEYLAKNNIVNGTSDTTFSPNDNVTREQYVKMLTEALGFTENGSDVGFNDVDRNMWYYPYICRGYNSGIVKGMDNGRFGVGSYITRQDLAVMTYRAAVMKGLLVQAAELNCADRDAISDYAREAVASMQKLGIINGMGDNRFEPLLNATRAQAAKIIFGIMLSLQ